MPPKSLSVRVQGLKINYIPDAVGLLKEITGVLVKRQPWAVSGAKSAQRAADAERCVQNVGKDAHLKAAATKAT
jgi:hypothetical protein